MIELPLNEALQYYILESFKDAGVSIATTIQDGAVFNLEYPQL